MFPVAVSCPCVGKRREEGERFAYLFCQAATIFEENVEEDSQISKQRVRVPDSLFAYLTPQMPPTAEASR